MQGYRARAGAEAAILTSWSWAKMEQLHNTACQLLWLFVSQATMSRSLNYQLGLHLCLILH